MAANTLVFNSHGKKYEVPRVRVSSLNELQRADHIAFHRRSGAYWHYAIVEWIDREKGEIHVIEYSNTAREYLKDNCGSPPTIIGKAIAKVVKGTYIFKNETVYLLKHERCLDPEDVIKKAVNKLGKEEYHPCTNNCEHFAMWCKTGKSTSDQVKKAKKMAVNETCKSIATSLAANIGQKTAKKQKQVNLKSGVQKATKKEKIVSKTESNTGEDPSETPEATDNDVSQTESNTEEDPTETPEATDDDASQTESNTEKDPTETPEATDNDASQTESNTGEDPTEITDASDNNVSQIESSIQQVNDTRNLLEACRVMTETVKTGSSEGAGESLTQAASKVGQEMVKSGTLEVAKTLATQTAIKAGEDVAKTAVREGSKKVLTESAGKSAAAGTGSFLAAGAVCSAAIETMWAVNDIRCAKEERRKGTISEEELETVVKNRIVTGVGSVGGSTLGTVIGQVVIPVPGVGAFVGSVAGGLYGRFVGNLMANSWFPR